MLYTPRLVPTADSSISSVVLSRLTSMTGIHFSKEVAESPVFRALAQRYLSSRHLAAMMVEERQMESAPHISWKLRAGGVISILYLIVLGMFEAYSAAATALDRHPAFSSWEPHLGWALFVLPCILIASLFLLHGRRSIECGRLEGSIRRCSLRHYSPPTS